MRAGRAWDVSGGGARVGGEPTILAATASACQVAKCRAAVHGKTQVAELVGRAGVGTQYRVGPPQRQRRSRASSSACTNGASAVGVGDRQQAARPQGVPRRRRPCRRRHQRRNRRRRRRGDRPQLRGERRLVQAQQIVRNSCRAGRRRRRPRATASTTRRGVTSGPTVAANSVPPCALAAARRATRAAPDSPIANPRS